MDIALKHFANAVLMGGIDALPGFGLPLIFDIRRIANFTHGELHTFGAYMMYFSVMLGVNFYVSILFAIMAGMALGGTIEFTLLRNKRNTNIDTTMLIMIGAWIVMQNAEILIRSSVAKSVPSPLPNQPLEGGPVSISWLRVAVALIVATYSMINRTRLGRAMQAAFQDRNTPVLMATTSTPSTHQLSLSARSSRSHAPLQCLPR